MGQSVGRALLVGLIWLFGLKYYIDCRRLPDPSENMTISAVFWVFTAFAAIELYCLYRRFDRNPGKQSAAGELFGKIAGDSRARLAVLTVVYLVLIPILGFFTASFFAFAAFSYALGTRGIWRILVPDLCVLVAIYVIFSVVLKLSLPSGVLV